MHYRLAWAQGPSAIIDVQRRGDELALRYEGPYRLAIRPLLETQGTADDLRDPVQRMRDVAGRTGIAATRSGAVAVPTEELLDNLVDSGDVLYRFVLPRFAAEELRGQSIFLEVGTDEALLHVPFELMCDDSDFICLRHAVGRYVNLGTGFQTIKPQPPEGDLSVLLICVPKPQPTAETTFANLPEAEAEFEAVSTLLMELGIDFLPLHGPDATKQRVRQALRGSTKFTVVHFTGHGHFDEQSPGRSGLALFDGILTIGEIAGNLDNPPALAFINGCETATAGGAAPAPEQLPMSHLTRVFGTARPFLERGSYVLGTRWRISDTASADFATAFYTSLLGGDPVGEAVRKARTRIHDPNSIDLSWASYVYYGDPRLTIRLDAPQQQPQGVVPQPVPGLPQPGLPPELATLADEYESLRAAEPSSWERTRKMSSLIQPIRAAASGLDVQQLLEALGSNAEGERLVAVVAAHEFGGPGAMQGASADLAGPLTAVLADPRSDFEEFSALTSLDNLASSLDDTGRNLVRETVQAKLEQDEFLASDRALPARELLRKVGPPGK